MLVRAATDDAARLAQARSDLADVEATLAAHNEAKAVAAADAGEYLKWRQRNDVLVAERERLPIVIAALESQIAENSAAAEDAAKRKRHADRAASNVALAARTTTQLAQFNAAMIELLRDHAEAAIETSAINQDLPEGLEPLLTADRIARGRDILLREEIKTEQIWLWVDSDSGGLVGDQDSVLETKSGEGRIATNSKSGPRRCVRRLFKEISFHPEQSAERITPIWQVRLVDPGGPQILFDGTDIRQPRDVLNALGVAENPAPRERPVEVELVPVPFVEANADAEDATSA